MVSRLLFVAHLGAGEGGDTTTIGLLKTAVELLKSAVGLAQKIKNADLNEKLVNLQTVILDLQSRLLELESEKAELAGELAKLKEIDQEMKNLIFSKGVYWKNLEGKGLDDPYCPNCWELHSAWAETHKHSPAQFVVSAAP